MEEMEMIRRRLKDIRLRIDKTPPLENKNYPKEALDIDTALSEVYKMIEEIEEDFELD